LVKTFIETLNALRALGFFDREIAMLLGMSKSHLSVLANAKREATIIHCHCIHHLLARTKYENKEQILQEFEK